MKKFSFHVLYMNFNSKKMESYDVMPSLYGSILTSKNKISKRWKDIYKVNSKETLKKYIKGHFQYCYWAKCEWEYIVYGWPTSKNERGLKIDVYQQLEPNIDLITNLLWEQIKDKL